MTARTAADRQTAPTGAPRYSVVVDRRTGTFEVRHLDGGVWPCGQARSGEVEVAWLGEPRLRSGARYCDPRFSEMIARGYTETGAGLFAELDGAWLIIGHDARTGTFHAATDRFATFELYWAEDDERLAVSSSGRTAIRSLDRRPQLDPQAIYDYLFFHMIPAPSTAWQGARRLGPGECLSVSQGTHSIQRHWVPRYDERGSESAGDLAAELMERLTRAVATAAGDESCGAFLSGGTDSSTVVGLLQRAKASPVDAYSVGFEAPGYDEMAYARIAAEHFRLRHHERYMRPADLLDAIPLITQAYDEPFGNASAAAAWFCALEARKAGTSVLLAGDGGDELFGGNERYLKQRVFERWWRLPGALRRPLETMATLLPNRPALLGKVGSYIRQAQRPLPDRLESYNFLLRTAAAEILEPEFLKSVDLEHPLHHLRTLYANLSSKSLVNRLMELDLRITLADNDLRKVRHMAEAAGVRARFPMLDVGVVDFAHALPPRLHLAGNRLRSFFKIALNDFLPAEIIAKRKHGFGLPFGYWINEVPAVRSATDDLLNRCAQRGMVRPTYLAEIRTASAAHPHYYGAMLWVLIILESWLEHHCDN